MKKRTLLTQLNDYREKYSCTKDSKPYTAEFLKEHKKEILENVTKGSKMEKAIKYIITNINKELSRAEVATKVGSSDTLIGDALRTLNKTAYVVLTRASVKKLNRKSDIYKLGLPFNKIRPIKRAGIDTVGDLLNNLESGEILKCRYLTTATICEILDILEEKGPKFNISLAVVDKVVSYKNSKEKK